MDSKLFQQENKFNNIMTLIFDILLLNILCLVCCIPLITAGAAVTALYSVMLKMVRNEEGGIAKSYFKAFRQNFRQSLPMILLFYLIMGVLFFDFHVMGASEKGGALIYGGCLGLLILTAAVFGYAFPLLARFDNTVKNTIKNAARMAVLHLPQTIVITFLNGLPVIWFLVSPETFAPLFWIWIFTGTGVTSFINSLLLVKIFDRYTQ